MLRSRYFLLALLLVAISFVLAKTISRHAGDHINITVSENERQLEISAEFPASRSRPVFRLLQEQLRLSDITDFTHLDINDYHTPDGSIRCYLSARADRFTITMAKCSNTEEACLRLKNAGDTVGKLLASQ